MWQSAALVLQDAQERLRPQRMSQRHDWAWDRNDARGTGRMWCNTRWAKDCNECRWGMTLWE